MAIKTIEIILNHRKNNIKNNNFDKNYNRKWLKITICILIYN